MNTIISRKTGLVIFVIGFVMLWLQGPIATYLITPYFTLFMPPEVVGNTPLSVTHIVSLSVLAAGIVIFLIGLRRAARKQDRLLRIGESFRPLGAPAPLILSCAVPISLSILIIISVGVPYYGWCYAGQGNIGPAIDMCTGKDRIFNYSLGEIRSVVASLPWL